MSYIRFFRLKAILQIRRNGIISENSYNQIIKVRFLDKKPVPPYYDSGSGKSFAGDNKYLFFELEINKVKLFLSKQLAAATDFLSASHYRYDWTILMFSQQGTPLKVVNKEQVLQNWEEMKSVFSKNYDSRSIDKYLEVLDQQMYVDRPLFPSLFQYLYFGLVFPNIPIRHDRDWYRTREITLSEEEQEKFQETITFMSCSDSTNIYRIRGKTLAGSPSVLSKFEGTVTRKTLELFPKEARVEVEFNRGEMITHWKFELKRFIL